MIPANFFLSVVDTPNLRKTVNRQIKFPPNLTKMSKLADRQIKFPQKFLLLRYFNYFLYGYYIKIDEVVIISINYKMANSLYLFLASRISK